ncbi:zinc finger protein 845-like [Rhinatrema bivittatum]|uniref:zinc finger protein 845-like n=1 Tax=Rhinatrema bivittatum TaxID=194408 RepID=UPI00112CC6A2|nr:zinc finger protein 845-like [Rhinatrema bivittatum]
MQHQQPCIRSHVRGPNTDAALHQETTPMGRSLSKSNGCYKRSTHESNLIVHQQMQMSERKYQCYEGGKQFNQRTSLMEHIRMHTGEMPYQCGCCGRHFRQQSNLIYHMRSHMEQSPPDYKRHMEGHSHLGGLKNDQQSVKLEPSDSYLNVDGKMSYLEGKPNRGGKYDNFCQLLDWGSSYWPLKRGGPQKSTRSKVTTPSDFLMLHRSLAGKRPFRCRRCPKKFNHKSNLAVHQRIHTGEMPFQCFHCDRNFRQQSNLIHHLKIHRPSDTANTEDDTKDFDQQLNHNNCQQTSRNLLGISTSEVKPLSSVDLGEKIKCQGENSKYGKSLGPQLHLMLYQQNHARGRPRKEIKSEEDLSFNSPLAAPGTRLFKCSQCFKRFSHESNLLVHLRVHTGEKTYRCHECGKQFSQRTSLMVHLRTHTGEMPYVCSQCGRSFRQQSNLIYHMKSHATQGVWNYIVNTENASQKVESNITTLADMALSKTKLENSSLGCKIKSEPREEKDCDLVSGQQSKSEVHKPVDTGVKSSLKHVRLKEEHTGLVPHQQVMSLGKRPYKCDQCFKRFSHQSNLLVHKRVHTGDRTYECQECSKQFSQRTSLMVHLRTHTGEMPYQCTQCLKTFRQQSNLIYHMKSHSTQSNSSCMKVTKGIRKRTEHRETNMVPKNMELSKKNPDLKTKTSAGENSRCEKGFNQLQHTHESKWPWKYMKLKTNFSRHTEHRSPQRPALGKRAFGCSECSKKFTRKSQLVVHQRVHLRERPYVCLICEKGFLQEALLDAHVRTQHAEAGPYLCHECGEVFEQPSQLLEHQKVHSSSGAFPSSEEASQSSSTTITVDPTLLTGPHSNQYLQHEKYGDGSADSEIPQPGMPLMVKVGDQQPRDTHETMSKQRPRHTCETSSPMGDRSHKENGGSCQAKEAEDGQRRVPAVSGCLRSWRAPARRRRTDPAKERPYKCADCEKRFLYPSKLATHRWTHSSERPYKCSECPKSFSYPSKLAAHRQTHTGERPYTCSQCQKGFSHRSKLAAHHWIHTKERPYKCTECPKSFCYPSKLAAHRQTHTGERPYMCSQCEKSFCYPSKLAAHRQIHTVVAAGGAPFPCNECGKSFRQLRNLQLHQRSHRAENLGGEGEGL